MNDKKEYYKKCQWCGKFVNKKNWLEKEKADRDGSQPLCRECAMNSDYPDV